MKSPGLSLTLSALFTLENFPGHKLGSQQLKNVAVFRELQHRKVAGRLFALFLVSVARVNNV